MAAVDISLIGDKELERKLQRIGFTEQKKIVRKAIREESKPVLKRAQQLAPVKTGRLKKGLVIRALKRSRSRIGVRIQTKDRDYFGIDASAKHFYPAVVEFKQKSYLRAAIDESRSRFISGVGRRIGRGIEAAAKR